MAGGQPARAQFSLTVALWSELRSATSKYVPACAQMVAFTGNSFALAGAPEPLDGASASASLQV